MSKPEEDRIGAVVVDSAVAVHSALRPGLLERTYELCLAHELMSREVSADRQVKLPLRYRDLVIDDAYRVDLLLNALVVVEIKAIETILPVHRGQVLSYLRLGGYKLGFLLNFNVARNARRNSPSGQWTLMLPFILLPSRSLRLLATLALKSFHPRPR